MNWNSNAPMELLSHMPPKLSKANLETIQAVIDNDKYICSTMLKRDLCGEYAPFCALCDKSMDTPCAVAYIRMKQAEGIKLEIAITDNESAPEAVDNSVESVPFENIDDKITAEPETEELSDNHIYVNEAGIDPLDNIEVETAPDQPAANIETAEEEVNEQPPKKVIRIAIAKRKK